MAHPLPPPSPLTCDDRLDGHAAWQRAPRQAMETHEKPMENVSHSAAHPRDPADARPVRTRAPATAPGAGRWPPAAAPRRIRMPAALVAGGALRVPAGWASGPPFPRPAAAGVAAVAESSRGIWASTRRSTSRRRVGVTPTRRGRRPPSIREHPSVRMTSPVPPQAYPGGPPRPGPDRRSYQIVSTKSSSVIFRSRVTRGRSSAIAVAPMKRSHGSPSASRGIR
jgi:hypothetical protein